MSTKTLKLVNGTDVFIKKNPNTPRIALCFNLRTDDSINIPGIDSLMTRLFTQGTKNRTAEDLAKELDSYAIEFSADVKPDYIRLKFLCLNEDFDKALELLNDIVFNSTFNDFDKELAKMEGEIIAELDSPRAKVGDNYYSTLFKNHKYGYTSSIILKNLKNLTKNDVINNYNRYINYSKKVVTVVGDVDFKKIEVALNMSLGKLPKSTDVLSVNNIKLIKSNKYAEIIKPDANQAHIIKGWITETSNSEDYLPLLLLNVILGSSGLSSRLFLELRDKKGLAYVVRSSYETFAQCGDFFIYIATEPKNIEVSLAGFKEELDKIQTILVSDEELENAKNNMLGKWAYLHETNENQAILYANYGIMGLGFDFNDKAKVNIKKVSSLEVQQCAKKYFSKSSVLSVLKP